MIDPNEPRVFCADVAELLAPHVTEDEAKELLADKVGVSKRTLWRVLSVSHEYVALGRADELLTAVGETINDCRLLLPDGTVEEPWDGS